MPDYRVKRTKKIIEDIFSSRIKGGPGSGNHGHAGRPGKVGGSAPKDSVAAGTDESGSVENPMYNPNFRKWFGKSKVIDENGNPLVVYHGTPAKVPIDAFDKYMTGRNYDSGFRGVGTYFSTKPHIASHYAEYGKPGYPSVYPVYLKMENPYNWNGGNIYEFYSGSIDLPFDLSEEVERITGIGFEYGVYRGGDNQKRKEDMMTLAETVTRILKDRGYDGVVKDFGGDVREYLAFDSNQIKSIFNEGTFDPDDPRILKEITRKGGPGSGHFDHAGRPGEVGGSATKKPAATGRIFNQGKPYYRYTHSENPMSDWGHAMFSDEKEKVVNHSFFGNKAWMFDPGKSSKNVAHINDLKERAKVAWEKTVEDYHKRGFYAGVGNDDITYHILSNDDMDFDDFFNVFNPLDIVNSAMAWDSDLGIWFYHNVSEPNNIGAVITHDGAIVWDESMISRSPQDDSDWRY